MLKGTAREAAAEFLGTFVLMVFGLGVNAQVTLGGGVNGEYLSINLGWGLAVTLAVYCCAGVSGAHINPAVTLALAAHKRFEWSKVCPYMIAQFAGAFAGAALVYLTYYDAIHAFHEGAKLVPPAEHATAGIFATYPQDYINPLFGGLIDQIVGTALLVLVVFALGDEKNSAPQSNLAPLIVGAIVAMIGMSYGLNTGYAINPARDFSPRLFTFLAGWGNEVFTAGKGFWWVPIVGPFVGGVIGGLIYDLFLTRHHPETE